MPNDSATRPPATATNATADTDAIVGPAEPLTLGPRLGQGAVATVHRVTGADGRTYAGKRLHDSHQRDEGSAARFAQEAALLAGLQHENLVRVYGRTRLDGADVLLMELVEGPSLDERIAREAPMPVAVVQQLATGIASGLHFAHNAGIVHRDLKPSNILLGGGEVPKIADFGMARATSLAGVDAHALTVLGTPDYMAPECLDPLAVDARADLYALGCMMFEMLTGRPPFAAATPLGVLRAHRDEPIPSLPDTTPKPLAALVERLLAKSPGDRPQAAEAVRDALAQMSQGTEAGLAVRTSSSGLAAHHDRCVACGAPLVVALGLCTDCSHPIAHIEAGGHTVLVTGPGAPGDKLDAALRARLRDWLEETPSLGLQPESAMTKKIPRMPFTLVTKVSEASAQSVVEALARLGLEAQRVKGGALALPAMRKKAQTMVGRAAVVAASGMGGLAQAGWGLAIFGVAALIGAGVMVIRTQRRVTRDVSGSRAALPPPIHDALQRVRKGVDAIEQRRHRQALRGVLTRVVHLAEGEIGRDAEAIDELVRASDAALGAAAQLDRLDRKLSALDRDSASEQARTLLHNRDTWASRLLSLTAALDALASRRAAAGARRGMAEDQERLDRLAAHVEALEEVQAND